MQKYQILGVWAIDKKKIGDSIFYYAPEILNKENPTEKVDCYSYGMVLYFLFNETRPFSEKSFSTINSLKLHLEKNCRPHFQEEFPKSLKDLISKCWQQHPKDRISFDEIVIN